MSEAQLKTGHFGCYFMRFWFLFKSCVLLGLSVRAYGPPPPPPLGRSPGTKSASSPGGNFSYCWGWEGAWLSVKPSGPLLGCLEMGSLAATPPMAFIDTWSGRWPPLHWWWWRSWPLTRPSLKPPLWGGGELSHYLWGVWGSPLTLCSGGRVSPTQALRCDPRGREVLECFLITWREGVSSLHLPFAGTGGAGATALLWLWLEQRFLGLFVQACWCFWFSGFARMGHMSPHKTQGHMVVLFSQPQDP